MKGYLFLMACLLTACGDPAAGSGKEETELQMVDALVHGGFAAPPEKFPATCTFQGDRSCSCVLVGPEALLTAAHCPRREVLARGVKRFSGSAKFFNPDLDERAAECQVDETLDLAVCKISSVNDRLFERLGTDPVNAIGADLLLTGIGCGSGFEPGTFLIGCTEVTSLPAPPDDKIGIGGPAFLCNVDSGGATYSLSSPCVNRTASDVSRLVAGINSSNGTVASVGTTAAKRFLVDWASRNSTTICGVTRQEDANCRR